MIKCNFKALSNRLIISLIFVFLVLNTSGQSFLVTNDEEKYGFEKISFDGDLIKIITAKDKLSFKSSEIKGYYSFIDDKFYFLIKNLNKFRSYLNKDIGDNFLFAERIVEGKIKLYKKEVIITLGDKDLIGKNTHWFVEKDNDFFTVYTKGRLFPKNDAKFEMMKTLIDNPKIMSILNDKNYKYTVENLIEVIKNYNLQHYKEAQKKSENPQLNKLILFRDNNKQAKDAAEFTIDQKVYSINKNEKLEVELPVDTVSMICINNDNNKTCELVRVFKYFVSCYEIRLDKNREGAILKKNKNSSYIKARFKYFNKKKN